MISVETFGLLSTHSMSRPLPWSARPSIPDPADRATNEDRCDRCWRENHEACPDAKATGVCCCEVDR